MKEPIGFFDSGIGGITILNATKKLLPNENYIYYADDLHNPYGDKSITQIKKYVKDAMDFLIQKNCKMIVIACNTASSVCVDELRKIYDIPIVATVPALKVAIDEDQTQNILVMATPATIQSEKFLEIYHKFYTPNIFLLPCPNLAHLIETNQKKEIKSYLKNVLSNYLNKEIKTVVLGCTHFPYIKDEIKEVLGNVKFVDGSYGISNRIKQLLIDYHIENKQKKGTIKFYSSLKKEN